MSRLQKMQVVGLLLTSITAGPLWADGSLVVCDGTNEPATLDPQHEFNEKDHTIVQQIYEGLVRFGPDGAIEPVLATSWERVDPLRMRFKLREDVKFHNGEPFTAEAVQFTLKRYLDPEIGFPARSFLGSIADVEIIDGHTVDIVTKYPDGLLLNRLAGFVVIVPPKYMQEHGEHALRRNPIGTGAFKFTDWQTDERIVLVANEDYWAKGLPRLDKLVFRFAPPEKQAELLLAGEVDLVTEMPGTLTTQVEQVDRARVVKKQTFWTVGATMRTDEGPLSDVRVRRALNLAIDRQALIRFDVRGNGSILASLTMPGEEGHNPDLKPYKHDPVEANRLLDEAGIERPLVLRTHVRAPTRRTVGIIAAQLKQVGVELDVHATDGDSEVIEALATEEWDLGIAGLPDPMAHAYFIQSLLLFSQSPYSLLNDSEVDRRIVEMVQTLDQEERARLGRELDAYVHDQALSLFTYQRIKTYAVRKGVEFTPYVSGMMYFFDATVEPKDQTLRHTGNEVDDAGNEGKDFDQRD